MTLCRSRWRAVSLLVTVLALGSPVLKAAPERPKESLGELLALYRTYELPLPPERARLVRFESGWRSVDDEGKETPLDYLGFLIQPATEDRPAVVLVGTQEITLRSTASKVVSVDPDPALAKDPTIKEGEYLFGLNSNLAFAIQCKARGWDGLAQSILESRRARVAIPVPPATGTLLPLGPSLTHTAWKHWENALVDPTTDRAKIAERMRTLLMNEPTFTEWDRSLLASLQATLEPSKAKPGTIEAMIDDLVNLSATGGIGCPPDHRLVELERLGFEAVPALITHWDDPRLTRCASPPINNSTGEHIYVRDLVRYLIKNLAGTGLVTDKAQVEKADAAAWWTEAQRAGEESYLVAHVLPSDEKEEWPSGAMLRIIARRYPRHLPGIYLTILERRPHMQGGPVADAIAESSLSRETKIELFQRAAGGQSLQHRMEALRHLRDLDPTRFATLLVATLEALPRRPQDPYWKCPEANVANLVLGTDDPRVWAMLEKVAKRSDVGLRMEILDRMTRLSQRKRLRPRLEFLAHFLDDAAVRDSKSNPRLYDGPGAAFQISKIEVRNFAAWQIEWILGMGAKPNADWTAEQWSQLRAQVHQELERELSREVR